MIDTALAYIRRDWSPIPLPARSKAPVVEGWPELRLTAETAGEHFNGKPQNIGVLLGEPSGGLIDVDLDHPKAVSMATTYLPETGSIFGRPGKPRSHFLYRVSAPIATHKRDHKTLGMIVELRSTGCQTVFPPSVHPSGEPITWDCDGEPPTITPEELSQCVDLLADAVLRECGIDPEAKPETQQTPTGKPAPIDVSERAARYIAKIPAAVSGQGGHPATFHVACVIVLGFGLTPDQAYPVLAKWNETCQPPWNEKELRHKLTEANKQGGERGYLLRQSDDRHQDNGQHHASKAGEGRLPLTDTGLAERFARLHGDRVRYCHLWGKWFAWDGRRWCPDDMGAVDQLTKQTARSIFREAADEPDDGYRKLLVEFARKAESAQRRAAMLQLARSEPPIPIRPEALDQNDWLLNCQNGTIDLRTGELRKHRQADGITKLCQVEYLPDATAPAWLDFLSRIFDCNEGLIGFIQRLLGYCLTGDTSEQVLPICWGEGANGKSTLVNVALDLLGDDYAIKAPPDLLLARRNDAHPTERADLFGKRVVAAVETDDGRRLAESLVKELTGGDRVRARRMREDFWQFRPTHKVILACNHKPEVRGTDHAIWRRLRLVPFNVVIPEASQDKHLGDKLREELPGILAWCVRGCLDWQTKGLGVPPEVETATASYRADEDSIGGFIEASCIIGLAYKVRAGGLYESYKTYCEKSGEPLLSQKRFGQRLTERGVKRIANNGTWYTGLGLIDNHERETEPTEPYGTLERHLRPYEAHQAAQ